MCAYDPSGLHCVVPTEWKWVHPFNAAAAGNGRPACTLCVGGCSLSQLGLSLEAKLLLLLPAGLWLYPAGCVYDGTGESWGVRACVSSCRVGLLLVAGAGPFPGCLPLLCTPPSRHHAQNGVDAWKLMRVVCVPFLCRTGKLGTVLVRAVCLYNIVVSMHCCPGCVHRGKCAQAILSLQPCSGKRGLAVWGCVHVCGRQGRE